MKYRYSLKKDIKNTYWTLKDYTWFKNHPDVVVFWPNPIRWLWLMTWLLITKKPKIKNSGEIICYFVSCGTWGAYHPDENAISICPYKINKSPDGNILDVIHHELLHLKHPEADELEHNEKEMYINSISKKSQEK